jgi:hypothetical protein
MRSLCDVVPETVNCQHSPLYFIRWLHSKYCMGTVITIVGLEKINNNILFQFNIYCPISYILLFGWKDQSCPFHEQVDGLKLICDLIDESNPLIPTWMELCASNSEKEMYSTFIHYSVLCCVNALMSIFILQAIISVQAIQ